MKFSEERFSIDRKYAAELKGKVDIFRQVTKTRKSILVVMVTTFGTQDNIYKTGLVQNDVTLPQLFR